jgi:hypothetical protein
MSPERSILMHAEIMAVNAFFGYLKRWNGCMESAPEDLPIQAGESYLCISQSLRVLVRFVDYEQ